MVKLWTNFAKTGNPNPLEGIVWKSASSDEMNFLDIDVELRSSVNPDDDRMKFWDEIYEMVLLKNQLVFVTSKRICFQANSSIQH